jgi:hypothetical protein
VKERLAGPGPARLVGVALERRSSSGKDRVRVSLDRRLRLLHGLLQEIHFRENCCLITNKLTFKFYLQHLFVTTQMKIDFKTLIHYH